MVPCFLEGFYEKMYSLDQPLTKVSIPQHGPSEALGYPGSPPHNGRGFTIATAELGALRPWMEPIPHTRPGAAAPAIVVSLNHIWWGWMPVMTDM